MDDKNLTFEEALKELEDISNKLEKGEVSLEESISLFERGFHLTKVCSKRLKEAKQKIVLLSEAEGEEE